MKNSFKKYWKSIVAFVIGGVMCLGLGIFLFCGQTQNVSDVSEIGVNTSVVGSGTADTERTVSSWRSSTDRPEDENSDALFGDSGDPALKGTASSSSDPAGYAIGNDLDGTKLYLKYQYVTGSVKITGTNTYNQKLTASVTNDDSATLAYQWYYVSSSATSGGTAISGATSSTYTIGSGLVGKYIYVVVTATKTNYTGATWTDVTDSSNTTATVAKASLSATVSMSGYTYAGTKSTPSVSSNPGSGTVTYYYNTSNSNSGGTAWSNVTSATSLNAGTYYMYATIAATTNYSACTTATKSFTIAKASGSVSTKPTAKSLTYTGSAQTLANAGTGTGTMYYSLSSSSNFSTTIPTGTNAGTYTVYYYAAASTNYNQSSTGNISVTVAKKSGSLSLSATSGTINVGSTTSFTVTRAGNGTISASSSATGTATVSVSGTTVTVTGVAGGSATITVSVAAGTNYKAISKTYAVKVNPWTDSGTYTSGIFSGYTWVTFGTSSNKWVIVGGSETYKPTTPLSSTAFANSSQTDGLSSTQVLLLSEKFADNSNVVQYNSSYTETAWTSTTLCTYLNNSDNYNDWGISDALYSSIATPTLTTMKNSDSGNMEQNVSNATKKIFTLAYGFSGENFCITTYLGGDGGDDENYIVNSGNGDGHYYWWLRSGCYNSTISACYVPRSPFVTYAHVDDSNCARPCFVLNLGSSCLEEGTEVATFDESTQSENFTNIEDISVGDKVVSHNFETGLDEVKSVTAIIRQEELFKTCKVTLYREDLDQTFDLSGTYDHPVYSLTREDYVALNGLEIGELVKLADGTATVISVTYNEEMCYVYNLVISDNHNFYVTRQKLLVHDES